MNHEKPSKRKTLYHLRTLFAFLLLLAGVAVGVAYSIFHATPEDFTAYHELIAEANPTLADKTQQTPYRASHYQEQVRKDFFAFRGKERLHFLLNSREVHFVIDHLKEATELTEELSKVRWWAQDELFFGDTSGNRLSKENSEAMPWQKIYQGTSDKAFFSYQNKTFRAENVEALGREIPGHELHEKLLLDVQTSPFIELHAQNASYDGDNIILSGKLSLKHPLGTLKAEKATAKAHFEDKRNPFDSVLLEEQISLSLSGKGTLMCHKALLDLKNWQANFFNDSTIDSFVVYSCPSNILNKPPILLNSRSLELKTVQEKERHVIDTITALDDVSVDVSGEFLIQADRGVYRYSAQNSKATSQEALSGIITFDSPTSLNRTTVSQKNGDHLSGSLVVVDTNQRQVFFKDPKGFISSCATSFSTHPSTKIAPSTAGASLEILSTNLLWDLGKNTISLTGATEVKYGTIGFLKNNQEITLRYSDLEGKKTLEAIEGEGHTLLCHYDESPQCSHWVICDGKIYLDHVKKVITFDSERDSRGSTSSDQQVFFNDALGEVQADKITIFYEESRGKLMATKIYLEGNVFLIDHKIIDEAGQKPKNPLHYALADFVEYTLLNKEMYFSSLPGNRVLFEDKINHLQVSAPALKITRDSLSKKEAIKGVGDVRFHFVESEMQQLRQLTGLNF